MWDVLSVLVLIGLGILLFGVVLPRSGMSG